jgi:ribonuclease P protein component
METCFTGTRQPGRLAGHGTGGGPGQAAAPDRRLARRQRLTRQLQFERTYTQGRRFAGRCMVLWCYQDADAALRLGVVASRRIGPAVVRNRAKRRLRELFRINRHRFGGQMDVVLVARPAIIKAAWNDLVEELNGLAARAGLSALGEKLETRNLT